MNNQSLIWIGMTAGSLLGGFVPYLWGASSLSVSGVIFGALGALAGIWAGFRLGQQ